MRRGDKVRELVVEPLELPDALREPREVPTEEPVRSLPQEKPETVPVRR